MYDYRSAQVQEFDYYGDAERLSLPQIAFLDPFRFLSYVAFQFFQISQWQISFQYDLHKGKIHVVYSSLIYESHNVNVAFSLYYGKSEKSC